MVMVEVVGMLEKCVWEKGCYYKDGGDNNVDDNDYG